MPFPLFGQSKIQAYEASFCDLLDNTYVTALEKNYVIQETVGNFWGRSGLRVALCTPPAEQSVYSTLNQLGPRVFEELAVYSDAID